MTETITLATVVLVANLLANNNAKYAYSANVTNAKKDLH